jgi:hypothetical protein
MKRLDPNKLNELQLYQTENSQNSNSGHLDNSSRNLKYESSDTEKQSFNSGTHYPLQSSHRQKENRFNTFVPVQVNN